MPSIGRLRTIPPDEVARKGEALAVRFCAVANEPEMVMVQITAHRTDDDRDYVRQSEIILIVRCEKMTVSEMQARVLAEASFRAIDRVAWLKEQSDQSAFSQ